MRHHTISRLAASAATAAVLTLTAFVGPASAALTLTAEGVAAGFNLTTFVSGYNFGGNYGPLAQGIDSAGHVITGSVGDRNVYVFKDVDNQTLADALSATHYTDQTGNPNYAMTSLNGHVYGAQLQGGDYREFFDNGSSAPLPGAVTAPGGLTNFLGLWGDPTSGLLFSASNSGLAKIDPLSGNFSLLLPGVFPDGITVSPDGKTLYIENGGTIQAYDALTGAFKHTFFTGHSPDGTGVITGGLHDGQVVVNNNDGTVGLLDPTKLDGDPTQYVIIAADGTRGDFVSPDRTNGTLFIAEINDVTRLSCGTGCSIGGPPPGVPEPAAWALMIAGFGLTGAVLRRRRARAATA